MIFKKAQLYKGEYEELNIKFSRVWAMPNAWTFSIHPIKVLIDRYIENESAWIDPFAGRYSPAGMTNDIDPASKARYHIDALDFAKMLKSQYKGFIWDGILYDPPYSFTQIKEHYKKCFNRKLKGDEHLMGFYEKPKSVFCEMIKPGGYAISFGWNTNGFGKRRGFKIIEIMAIAHGGSKNDTLCVVEQKLK